MLRRFLRSATRTLNAHALFYFLGHIASAIVALVGCYMVAEGYGDLARTLGVMLFLIGLVSYVGCHFGVIRHTSGPRPR